MQNSETSTLMLHSFPLSFKHMFFCLRMINIFLMFFLTEGKPVLYIKRG